MGDVVACGVMDTGQVRCWELFNGENGVVFAPPGDTLFTSISVGYRKTQMYSYSEESLICGIRADNGQEACWGTSVRNIWQGGDGL